jgi:hypothetical protein
MTAAENAYTSRCFLCAPEALAQPPDSPADWVPATHVCARHEPPRLASGRPLFEVLDARRVLHNGDWRTQWLFNPAFVEGKRAWFDLAAGGIRFGGEAFPSTDAFEYFVQHESENATELLALHRGRARFASGVDLQTLLAYWAEGRDRQRRLERLCRLWTKQRNFAAFRDRIDPHRRLPEEEVLDLAHGCGEQLLAFSWDDGLASVQDLLTLAGRRFGTTAVEGRTP